MIFTNLYASGWSTVGKPKEKGLFDFDFITEQAIDSKIGGIVFNKNWNTIRRYVLFNLKDKGHNEPKPPPRHLDRMNLAWIISRKKCLITVLVIVLILAITAIVVPISMYALNDTKSSGTSTTSIVPATTILATTTLATTTGKPLKRQSILCIIQKYNLLKL